MFFLPVYHSNGWLISLFCQPAHLFNFLKYFLHSQLYSFAFHLIYAAAAAAAKSLQSCPTLCDPIDGSSPGSPIPGILQARTLEWVAISFSNAWKWKVKVKSLSRVQLLATPWTAAYQAPPAMGFSRQEYWSGVTLPSLLGEPTEVFICRVVPEETMVKVLATGPPLPLLPEQQWCFLVWPCRMQCAASAQPPAPWAGELRGDGSALWESWGCPDEQKLSQNINIRQGHSVRQATPYIARIETLTNCPHPGDISNHCFVISHSFCFPSFLTLSNKIYWYSSIAQVPLPNSIQPSSASLNPHQNCLRVFI